MLGFNLFFTADEQNYHGTATLSNVGGWAPGNLIGAAFGASFILAKTVRKWQNGRGVDVVWWGVINLGGGSGGVGFLGENL